MTITTTNRAARTEGRGNPGFRALGFVLLASIAMTGTAQAQTATDLRENAVRDARAGKMAEAQASLRALLVTGPDDGLVAMDLVTLLEQDGKSREAAAIFARANKADPPAYALQAAVRANQAIGQQDEARRLVAEGQRRFPGDPAWAELEKRASVKSPTK